MEIQDLILDIFYSFVLITFVIRTVRNSFYHTFYWQLKEYRLDRYIAHLKTPLGRNLLFSPITLFKWALIAVFILTFLLFLNSAGSNLFNYFNIMRLIFFTYWFIIILEGIFNVYELVKRKWMVPRVTLKVSLILFTILIIQLSSVLGTDWSFLFILPIFDKSLPILVFLMVLITTVPTYFYKKIVIYIAGKKIKGFKNLKVIGVTGSFGKTSTKEFLASILAYKYEVAKTSGSVNTGIGIAKYIIKDMQGSLGVFVIEMGAYKKGEIAQICRIVDPEIGIVTGINQQHIELFGSIEKTVAAKFELIKNLKEDGVAVLNVGNIFTESMVDWCKVQRPDLKLWTYQRISKPDKVHRLISKRKNLLVAYGDKIGKSNLSFKLKYQDQVVDCQAKLAGAQNIDNILAAACVALECGFSLEEIKNAISHLKSPEKTMRLLPSIGKLSIVDDTFNANPDGVLSALEYMKVYKGIKILILTPLIELGKESWKAHELLGKKAASVCDFLLLTNSNYKSSILAGANIIGQGNKVQLVDRIIIKDTINRLAEKEGVVVFEGKEAGKILRELRTKN